MRSLDLLMEEYRVVRRALDLLERASLKLLRGERVDLKVFSMLLRFLREFDLRSMEKEERVCLLVRSRNSSKLVDSLISEHGSLAGILRALLEIFGEDLESMDLERVRSVIGDVLGYVRLRRTHISKVEDGIFKLAQETLNEDDDRKLIEEFEEIEAKTPPGGKEQLIKLLDEVETLLKTEIIRGPSKSK